MKKDISIVIPVYNEEESITPLIIRLDELKKKMPDKNFEIIFVDDGSTDRSFDVLKGMKAKNEDITIVRFKKNFGQTGRLQTFTFALAKSAQRFVSREGAVGGGSFDCGKRKRNRKIRAG